MRIFITGGQGQLGIALQRALAGHQLLAPGHAELDILDRVALEGTISRFRPKIVIHAAAWTDTAGCERDPSRAYMVNVVGTRLVAQGAAHAGAALLYVSSNEVFDGEKGEAYLEYDAPNPINAYGRSKLEGEQEVQAALEKYWIVRSSWLYGAGRMSFPEKIIKAAQEQGSLQVVTDEIASPTWTDSLAEGIARLIKHPIWGIYHLTNTGKCSRFDWAKAILQEAGLGDIPIRPTTLAHYPNPYRKPPFTVLGNQKAAILGIELPHWQQALADYFKLNSQVAQTS